MQNSTINYLSDTIRFECVTCGAILPSFNAYDAHITAHLIAQAAPLRTLRRTVRANKIMIAKSEPRETGIGHFPYLFEKVSHE